MKWAYKILRALLLLAISLAVVVPATLYVLLSLSSVQEGICHRAESELSRLLGITVDIDHISLSPFNRVTLHGMSVYASAADTMLSVDRLGAGISLNSLIKGRIVVNYAEIIGLEARIHRATPGSPLNIQPIIDALKPKDKNKPPKAFDFRINTVVIRRSAVSYDVLSEPSTPGRFNPNHIQATDFRADLQLPRMANDDFTIDLRRLALAESCGLVLENLSGYFHIAQNSTVINGLSVRLPYTVLDFKDMEFRYTSLSALGQELRSMDFDVALKGGSRIATADFVPLVPALAGLDLELNLTAHVSGNPGDISISDFSLYDSSRLSLDMHRVRVTGLTDADVKPAIDMDGMRLRAASGEIASLTDRFGSLAQVPRRIVSNLGAVELDADYKGTVEKGVLEATLGSDPGNCSVSVDFARYPRGGVDVKGNVTAIGFSGATLLAGTKSALEQFGEVDLDAEFDLSFKPRQRPQGTIDAHIPRMQYRGHTYTDIDMYANIDRYLYNGGVHMDNPGVSLDLTAEADLNPEDKSMEFNIDARDVDLASLNLVQNTHGRKLSVTGSGALHGPDMDHMNGQVHLTDISFVDADGSGVTLNDVLVEAHADSTIQEIRLASDLLDAYISGHYRMAQLPAVARGLVERVLPNLTGLTESESGQALTGMDAPENSLTFDIRLKETAPLEDLVKLPVRVIYPVSVTGGIDSRSSNMSLNVDAPYLQQGNRLIENTALSVGLDAGNGSGRANMYFTTMVPTKKGDMTLSATAFGSDGHLDTQVAWHVQRERRFNGDVNVTASFSRGVDHELITSLNVNPGKMVFNDTVWTVDPARILIEGKRVEVEGFKVWRPGQYLTLEGAASDSEADSLVLSLREVSLDYVFETLGIENAMFGGDATGDFYVNSVFTKHPVAYTPALDVRGLKYNYSLLGDARIKAGWDADAGAVTIYADIKQPNGCSSIVDGRIIPMADSLDLWFDADRISIGFLKPFMSAFATEVSGYASGKARLWGSFKLIDMVGDIYGEDVSLTLGFTNTKYTCTDSVHLRPGRIDLHDITLRDVYDHTAKLNGWLTHKCFKEPEFNFNVTEARSLLVYDVKEAASERWYGHVFGDGWATVRGVPGSIDIEADIATAAGSSFTFVLSDALQAYDYDFITFRDRDRERKDLIAAANAAPEVVRMLKERIARSEVQGPPTVYNMDISVDVRDNTQMNLVMDPVGGDRIRAYGSGRMRMTYGSSNDELRLFGTYTLVRGSYNFTLQDIIIKDFTIREGSSITFNGNPYTARLDIHASYSTNANLSDLDESFLQDKELKRTNVPVNALLNVEGDMRQPDISFGLDFPTLTSDIKRKVLSIVNTEEMMNRQIIYLLALNRFYTPEYMSATKGNEWVSVASSTISSQLSNMLGQLSDKWSISPNFRSDRGDFSDVEVDLALSSHLLNNRLLLNGNFGYRDKALNNNSFIGDFDIEYLLNRSGSIRLKAYNRYNDQNYYLKSALTTQGVGVVFKRDFDDLLSFLKPLRRHKDKNKTEADSTQHTLRPDTVTAIVTDTVTIVPVRE
ncbi:MAG: translocation/assembly module TamB [Muribaculaceae bacterium]|nr:translocation/assembly module TamB [Muribaculaceae bacterium]